jgi:3-oxoacyl-[acyl-carrier-protein] synthase II
VRALRGHDAAVTGLGLVTPLGFGVEASWGALLAGRSAVRDVEGPDAPPGTRLAALVAPPHLRVPVPDALLSQAKFLNGSGEMAATAAAEAMDAARALDAGIPGDRRGFYMAQGDNERSDCLAFRTAVLTALQESGSPVRPEALNRASITQVKPWYVLETIHNNAFSLLSAWWDLRGANTSMSGWTGTGSYALALAARSIPRGDADGMLVAGTARTAGGSVRAEMAELGLATKGRDGAASYRPLDRRRDGAVPSEGAGVLWMERRDRALERGVPILAVVAGLGAAWGPPDAFGPPADALHAAARDALREAEVEPRELLGVVLPGTGTRGADDAALEAADRLLGSSGVPVAAWKGATGIAACASDTIEAALAVRSLVEGVLPGTVGFEEADPAHARLQVARTPVRREGRAVLQLSGGLDGQATAVCFVRP